MEEAGTAAGDEVEDAAAFLEESSLLGEEQRKAIEVDLLVVGLDLREIRVDGQVEGEVP
jgi:hypothetical protein